MSGIDLLLLHPPSVYDFRQKAIMYGPISDMIPSSPVFEMYPLGFLTMAAYLEEHGLRVRIVNLALRMMNDPDFDVPDFLARMSPKAIGIDLHWLPHAHGSLEIARLHKDIHPQVPIILGGLSATYFHEELILYPHVDYVIRGDSTEAPLHELLSCLQAGQEPEHVPNLTWKADDAVKVNPFSFMPISLDYVDLMPKLMVRMVLRYRDLQSILPFNGWWKNPITAIFTAKGCVHNCVTCGGSSEACAMISKRQQPVFRSPQNLVKNMKDISRTSRGPIFLIGDLRQTGDGHAYKVLELLRAARIKNEIIFEFFGLPSSEFLQAIDRSVKNWSIELSPESHDESIRRVQDEKVFYTNQEMEQVIQEMMALRCHRVDIFFMIGLPRQTRESVMETIGYCERLFKISDRRVSCFISPMGPFLDPGSRGFEEPERFGYRLFARSLEEHRQLLIQPSWKYILNYETEWMDREALVMATYDAAEALNRLKLTHGRIGKKRGEIVADRIRSARELKHRLDNLEHQQSDSEVYRLLQGEINEFSVSTTCDKQELFWRPNLVNFKWINIFMEGLAYLADGLYTKVCRRG